MNETFVFGFKLRLTISNTERAILDWIHVRYRGNITEGKGKSRIATHKPVFTWFVSSADEQREFIKAIRPYSIIKAPLLDLASLYIETIGRPGSRLSPEHWETRLGILHEFRERNSRGAYKHIHEAPPLPTEGWRPTKRYNPDQIATMMTKVRAAK